jgi:hypothetical protein
MSLDCEYCKKSFATPYTLLNHQKKAQFCLKLQGKTETKFRIEEDFICDICEKTLSTKQSLTNHKNICIKKNIDIVLKQNDELKLVNANLKETVKEKNKLIIEKEKEKEKLLIEKEKQLEKKDIHIKELEDRLERLANKAIEQPNNVSYNNNSTNLNLAMFNVTTESTKQILKDKMKREHLYYGMGGFADFAKEHLLTLENGEMIYKCFDVSRQIFKYVDNHGVLIKDVKARKLMSIIREPVVRRILEIINEYNIEYETLNKEIYDMNTDTSALRNKISQIDYFKKEALKLKSDINMMEENNKFALELSTRLSD